MKPLCSCDCEEIDMEKCKLLSIEENELSSGELSDSEDEDEEPSDLDEGEDAEEEGEDKKDTNKEEDAAVSQGFSLTLDSDESIIAALKELANKESQSSDAFYRGIENPFMVDPWDKNQHTGPGSVMGALTYRLHDQVFDCARSWRSVPIHPHLVDCLESNALFILLVENQEICKKLALFKFWETFPCIILSGNGRTRDRCLKLFLRKLKMVLKLPVFALVNCNPRGYRLLSYYSCGWVDDKCVYVPPMDIICLGLFPSELDFIKLPTYPMEDKDKQFVEFLRKNSYLYEKKPELAAEVEHMMNKGLLAKLHSLDVWGFDHCVQMYLPWKLQKVSKGEI